MAIFNWLIVTIFVKEYKTSVNRFEKVSLFLFLLGIACPLGVASSEEVSGPQRVGLEESVRVDWVNLPISLEAREGVRGIECGALQLEDISQVTEDGEKVELVELKRRFRPVIHALLLDTSKSMEQEKKIERAKAAAKAYIEWLTPEEKMNQEVGIYTFDNDLLQRAPLTPIDQAGAKERLTDAIEGISTGTHTALIDSLYQLILHLGSYAERTIIVLLSDGADNLSSLDRVSLKNMVAAFNNLSIFPVGLKLRTHDAQGRVLRHRDFLRELAQNSGGVFFDLQDLGKLKPTFEEIRARIQGEATLVYKAKPFGQGPKDKNRLGSETGIFREIRVKSKQGKCTLNYRRMRHVKNDTLKIDSSGENSYQGTESSSSRAVEPNIVELQVNDTLLDSGDLYFSRRKRKELRLGTVLPHQREVVPRKVQVFVPPLPEEKAPRYQSPEDIVHDWLRGHVDVMYVPTPGEMNLGEQVANGKTLFEVQRRLSVPFPDLFPSYFTHTEAMRKRQIRRELFHNLPSDFPSDRLEELVELRVQRPSPQDVQKYLLAWLGDISARELAFALERKEINGLLSVSEENFAQATEIVGTVSRRWEAFRSWFGPPQHIRTLVLLTLAYDPAREIFGFYRVVFPRPRHGGLPLDLVPERPRGIEFVQDLLANPLARAKLRRQWKVESVTHQSRSAKSLSKKEVKVLGERLDHVGHLTLHLVSSDGKKREVLNVFLSETAAADPVPLCLSSRNLSSAASEFQGIGQELGIDSCGPLPILAANQ